MYQTCYYLESVHPGMPDGLLTDTNAAVVTGLALVDAIILDYYPAIPAFYDFNPRYQHKQSGERWKDVWGVLRDGYGDCKDFVAWRLAELWEQGVPASAKSTLERHSGGRLLFHTFIVLPNGAIEDPARNQGM